MQNASQSRKPTARFDVRAAFLLALAASAQGCPMPTGQRRGSLDADGGPCDLRQRPAHGELCETNSAVCDFTTQCPTSPAQRTTQRCRCANGRWSCATLPCYSVLADGAVACPGSGSPESMTFACSAMYEGRTCPITPITCSSGTRPVLQCECNGSLWICPEGPHCGPLPPQSRPSAAGRTCVDESTCSGLRCDRTRATRGLCTNTCRPIVGEGADPVACMGTGAVCAPELNQPAIGFCTNPCNAGGSVCTTGMRCSERQPYVRTTGPGCVPFCRIDADCPSGARCRVRSGECIAAGAPPEPANLLEDGEACTVRMFQSMPNQCQGVCYPNARGATLGVCGTPKLRSESCPSADENLIVRSSNDDLEYCMGRTCDPNNCCFNGLVCEQRSGAGFRCGVDTALPNLPCLRPDAGAPRMDASAPDAAADAGVTDAANALDAAVD